MDAELILNRIQQNQLINPEDDCFHYYDEGILVENLSFVNKLFPEHWIHSVAIKTNPLTAILKSAVQSGFGLEAASHFELIHGKNQGANFLIFDSPVKTKIEREFALNLDGEIYINANSLDEFIDLQETKKKDTKIGLRINPEGFHSAHESMTTATAGSKFGESILNKSQIIEAFSMVENGSGVHVHASSSNDDMSASVLAIKQTLELVNEINQLYPQRIKWIDIGGGVASAPNVNHKSIMREFESALKDATPQLFDGSITVFTEFGRFYHANAGASFSKIEEVKIHRGGQTIIQHLGADSFVREIYQPSLWIHDFEIIGNSSNKTETSIAGPLCFGGDYLKKSVELPKAKVDDWLYMSYTGANSYALWSAHCSRAFPKCIMRTKNDDYIIIKEKSSPEEILSIWS